MKKPKEWEKCPWQFDGKEFREDIGRYAGFVYLITELTIGKMYVGKKFFHSLRKLKGKTRRSKTESDWQKYFGSSDILKERVKEDGGECYRREILSLHELKRDVNFNEVREQFLREVLTAKLANGERAYFNDNIQGRFWSKLVDDWQARSVLCR